MNQQNTDQTLVLLRDQFTASPQVATVIAMTDALFGGVKSARLPNPSDKLNEAIALANRLELLCGYLERELPTEHESALDENKGFAQDMLVNFTAIREAMAKPNEPCDCGGKCDSCVAARSDEHHDRKRDGGAHL